MEEVMAAESEHESGLSEGLNEMLTSLEIAQSKIGSPSLLSKNHKQVAGIIHSIKGLGQSFGLATIAEASHELEEALGEVLNSGQNPETTSKLADSFRSLMSLIVVSKSLCSEEREFDLGRTRSRPPEVHITVDHFRYMEKQLRQIIRIFETSEADSHHLSALKKFGEKFQALEITKLETVFPRLQRIINDTARLLNKRVDFVTLNHPPTPLPADICNVFFASLIQLVKNAVYHGIESVSERKFLGKPETGKIELSAEKNSETIAVTVKDDGRGVNLKKISEKAIQLKLPDSDSISRYLENGQQDAILNCLWNPGFSTADSVSLISGRGVGLSLIKSEVESLGGTVRLTSEEGKGTTVILTIPFNTSQTISDTVTSVPGSGSKP